MKRKILTGLQKNKQIFSEGSKSLVGVKIVVKIGKAREEPRLKTYLCKVFKIAKQIELKFKKSLKARNSTR